MKGGVASLLIPIVLGVSSCATSPPTPDDLRQNHAKVVRLTSNETVDALFPKLLQATKQCWDGEVTPGAMGLMFSSASRSVLGEEASDKRSAYIVVQAKGMLGTMHDNFLQIDMKNDGKGAAVDVFYEHNVKGQRQFVGQVEHWLNGELTYCDPHPFIQKKKEDN